MEQKVLSPTDDRWCAVALTLHAAELPSRTFAHVRSKCFKPRCLWMGHNLLYSCSKRGEKEGEKKVEVDKFMAGNSNVFSPASLFCPRKMRGGNRWRVCKDGSQKLQE